MLREHSLALAALLRIFDLLAVAAAWPLARAGFDALGSAPPALAMSGPPPLAVAAALLAWGGASLLFGLYGSQRRKGLPAEIASLGKSLGAVALLGLSAWAGWPGATAPSLALGAAFFTLAFLLLAGSRLVLRLTAYAVRRRGYNTRYFAVVGSGEQAEALVEHIAGKARWGYSFLGYVREQAAPAEGGVPVLGRLADLGHLLEEHVIDEIYFAATHDQLRQIEPAVQLCQEQGVLVHVSLDAFAPGPARMTVAEAEGRALLTFRSTPGGGPALMAKRALDVLASAGMLLLLAPVLAAIALATWYDSRGPVLFRQRRVGLNGREFTFYKFRSMRVDAEAELSGLRARNEMDGPVFKMLRDPRVTRVGRFLRKTSLDELPQFWNVLRGEMSLVGPRPPLPAEVRQYKPWQRRRLSVKPGITCTWQVSGRNEVDFEQWMRLDLAYIDGWSFWGDVGICLRTIPAVLLARGAR
ncbi:MAG: sugar transferase [Deltaproteobacteria bacterium]|nr:sugar transferase [Deltaproteobacteria bacterium]